MSAIEIEISKNVFKELTDVISDKNLVVASVRSINVAIRKSNTQYRREVVRNYNLKYSDTAGITHPKRATYGDPEGIIAGDVKPISISRFNPSVVEEGTETFIKNTLNKNGKSRSLAQLSKETRKKNTGGVVFSIRRGEKMKIPFAFMINSEKAGVALQVWARGEYKNNEFETSKSRLPISPLKTVSPFGALTAEPVKKEVEKGAKEAMQKEFDRQVDLLMKK